MAVYMNLNYGENRALGENHFMTLAQFSTALYPWLDLLWIPAGMAAVERGKWFLTSGFILSCVLLLRLQIELMQSIGAPYGFFGFIGMGIYNRGLITYGVFIALFLVLAHFSRGGDKNVHMVASITIMIMAFCVSSLVMVL